MVLFSSVGDILLSKGMKRIGEVHFQSPSQVFGIFLQTIVSGTIWMGIACLLLFFVCYLMVLSWADYSYVMPASAIGYAVVAFLGYWVLSESVTTTRWMGVGLICLGVALVGGTPPRTTQPS